LAEFNKTNLVKQLFISTGTRLAAGA